MYSEKSCIIGEVSVGFFESGASDDGIFVRKSRHYVPTDRTSTPKISVKTVDQIEGLWCILNVQKCGLEFPIEKHLRGIGIETFIARQKVKKQCWVRDSRYAEGGYWARRLSTTSYFPTYFFAAIKDDVDRHRIIETRPIGTKNILDVHETDQLELVSTLRSLEISYENNPSMTRGQWQKRRGDKVEVIVGAFRGMKGEIVKVDGKNRLHVGIRTLGQPVELEIDPDECELL